MGCVDPASLMADEDLALEQLVGFALPVLADASLAVIGEELLDSSCFDIGVFRGSSMRGLFGNLQQVIVSASRGDGCSGASRRIEGFQ